MLSANPPETMTVAVIGRGRKVVATTHHCDLDRKTVLGLTVDDFLPATRLEESPNQSSRVGLQEFGLPFVADPAITRHLAEFVRRHVNSIRAATNGRTDRPDAVLFNGGVFNAELCRRKVLDVMRGWFRDDWTPVLLDSPSFDLAVAEGAAFCAWARVSGAKRIRSAAARSYYIEIGDGIDSSRTSVLCVVPHGLDEGEQISVTETTLELQVGEPAAFPLYSSSVRLHDKAGQILEAEPGQLCCLPALTTILRGGRRAGRKRIAVKLEAKLTEIGTLELYCAAKEGQNRWKLQFQTMTQATSERASFPEPPADKMPVVSETWSHDELEGARVVLEEVFGKSSKKADPGQVATLPKRLETALAMSRKEWPTAVLRALWDPLVELADGRKHSAEHEWRWYNLVGFCLRPGWGDPIDTFRVEALWKVIHQGALSARNDRVWSEYWIMCRRVAGGLDAGRQKQLSKRLLPYVLTAGRKPPRRIGPQEQAEIWRAVSSLEHLEPVTKRELGKVLLKQLRRKPVPPAALWSLTRLGARVPLYGPANHVVSIDTAENWLESILKLSLDDLREQVDFAMTQIARCSGDRARDIDDRLRNRVLEHLRDNAAADHWIKMVAEFTALDSAEQGQLLGDAVPIGLTLVRET